MARLHPFRFGVFAEGVRSRAALLDTARRAEDGGFATFLIRDHFIAEPFGHQLAPLTALATVAAVTRTLRIGSLVFANDYTLLCWPRRSPRSMSCRKGVSSSGWGRGSRGQST